MTDRLIYLNFEKSRGIRKFNQTQMRLLAPKPPYPNRHYVTDGTVEAYEPGALGLVYVCPDHGRWHAVDNPKGCSAYAIPFKHQVGDRLWVREPFAFVAPVNPKRGYDVIYRGAIDFKKQELFDWWPAPKMSRIDSGMTLIVTDVRVQRLQDISEADAIAEGCTNPPIPFDDATPLWESSRAEFQDWWIGENSERAWKENPFVVAYTFDVVLKNIDQIDGPDVEPAIKPRLADPSAAPEEPVIKVGWLTRLFRRIFK